MSWLCQRKAKQSFVNWKRQHPYFDIMNEHRSNNGTQQSVCLYNCCQPRLYYDPFFIRIYFGKAFRCFLVRKKTCQIPSGMTIICKLNNHYVFVQLLPTHVFLYRFRQSIADVILVGKNLSNPISGITIFCKKSFSMFFMKLYAVSWEPSQCKIACDLGIFLEE